MCPGGTALSKPDPFQSFDFVSGVETPLPSCVSSDLMSLVTPGTGWRMRPRVALISGSIHLRKTVGMEPR